MVNHNDLEYDSKKLDEVDVESDSKSSIWYFLFRKIAWALIILIIISFLCYLAFFVFASNQYVDVSNIHQLNIECNPLI